MSLGVYPDTTLKLAREQRDIIRKQIAEGINPATTHKIEKVGSTENTFEAISKVALVGLERTDDRAIRQYAIDYGYVIAT